MPTDQRNKYLNCSPVVNLKLLNLAFDGSILPSFTGKKNKIDISNYSVTTVMLTKCCKY